MIILNEPVISLVHDLDETSGTYYAQMKVSGFKTAEEAGKVLQVMQKMFCGKELSDGSV